MLSSSHIVFHLTVKLFMPFTLALFCLPHPSTDSPLPTCGTKKNHFSLFKKRRPMVQQRNSLNPWVFYCAQRGTVCCLSLSRGWRQRTPPGERQLTVSSCIPSGWEVCAQICFLPARFHIYCCQEDTLSAPE